MIEDARFARDDFDKMLVGKLNSSIEILQSELNKNVVNRTEDDQKEIEMLLHNNIPKIR